ncbi:MAG: T9SS type A sorting domain-containing protein, partial [Bacteroidales bacterium]|nr:T9SS type A sorting domain-containing protein [Bacteroidales bacterium]
DGRTRCVPTDNGLVIYPNPTGGTLTVESASPIRQITVYDLSGRVMMTVGGNGTAPCSINVTSLHSGIYILKALTDSGVPTARFVKN